MNIKEILGTLLYNPYMKCIKNNKGFTLVELSIVIVIIGLIVAGVVAGQSLVKQANLRKITSEATQYRLAINTFKLEFDSLPGDMTNAHSYWGNSCATNANDCNGNGDGYVHPATDGPNGVEALRAWQHLELAGLINNVYSGVGVQCNGTSTLAGVNIPKGPIGSGTDASGWSFSSYPGGLGIKIGSKHHPTCWYHFRAFISTADAYNIDLKTDDGDPRTGQITSMHALTLSANPNCVNGSDEYNLAFTDIACALSYKY